MYNKDKKSVKSISIANTNVRKNQELHTQRFRRESLKVQGEIQ